MTEKLKDTDDRDLAFVLKRLNNSRNKIGHPLILISDTVLLENNEPTLFVYIKKINGMAKLMYRETSEDKPIRWLEIKRAMNENFNDKEMCYHDKYVSYYPKEKIEQKNFVENMNYVLP